MDWFRETARSVVHFLATWSTVFCVWLADTILALGYPGIIFLMAVESSFIPFPSEIVMPPAGYLVHQGQLGWIPVIASGIIGSLLGALINYFLAQRFGRPFFLRFGRYVFLKPEHIERAERFFQVHGEITTFVGRLIPVIRQLISLPAGMARMPLGKFCLYTCLGSGIWITVLTVVGYLVGQNKDLLAEYLRNATFWAVGAGAALACGYWLWWRKRGGGKGVTGGRRDASDAN